MRLQPSFYVSAAMGVEIVHDEVDDLTFGHALIEQVEEREEDRLGRFSVTIPSTSPVWTKRPAVRQAVP